LVARHERFARAPERTNECEAFEPSGYYRDVLQQSPGLWL
jgi:hypothetical protein